MSKMCCYHCVIPRRGQGQGFSRILIQYFSFSSFPCFWFAALGSVCHDLCHVLVLPTLRVYTNSSRFVVLYSTLFSYSRKTNRHRCVVNTHNLGTPNEGQQQKMLSDFLVITYLDEPEALRQLTNSRIRRIIVWRTRKLSFISPAHKLRG